MVRLHGLRRQQPMQPIPVICEQHSWNRELRFELLLGVFDSFQAEDDW